MRNNPYLLLAAAAAFWSGNHIVGRAMGGEVPPIGISCLRWLLPVLVLWVIAREHIVRDWPVMRRSWGILLWLGFTGGTLFSVCQYIGLQYTTALNVSVLNSLVPVMIVAAGGLIFGDRISALQLGGILVSSFGVLVIIGRGEFDALRQLAFNWGDIIIVFNMAVFAIYAAYLRKQPKIHPLSFLFALAVISSVTTLPLALWEMALGFTFKPTVLTLVSILYVSIFPSLLAFAAWNRGVALIGANRAGPFTHLVPVYTAVFSTVLLGEHLATFHIVGFALILSGVWLASRPAPLHA